MDTSDVSHDASQRRAAAARWMQQGVVQAVAEKTLTVNLTGNDETVQRPYDFTVNVGDIVAVARFSGAAVAVLRMTGTKPAVTPPPQEGTVTAVTAGSSRVTLNTSIGAFQAKFVGASPAVSSSVAILWQPDGSPLVLGAFGTTAAPPAPPVIPDPPPPAVVTTPPAPPAPPPAPPQTGTSAFSPIDSATWRDGKWRTDTPVVAQGTYPGYGANSGSYFYGSGPASTLAGATVTGCRVFLVRESGGVFAAQQINLHLHSSPTRPGADVTRTHGPLTTISLPRGGSGWFDLGAGWGAALAAGSGLSITGNPYVNLAGYTQHAMAGQIHIDWQRGA